mgnify:CR=1 FL=1
MLNNHHHSTKLSLNSLLFLGLYLDWILFYGEGGASSLLSDVLLLVVLADTQPLSQSLTLVHIQKRDTALLGQSNDELLDGCIIAVIGENNKLRFVISAFETFADLVETLS